MEGNRGLRGGSVIPEKAPKDQKNRQVFDSWNKREGGVMSLISKTVVAIYIRPNLSVRTHRYI